MLRPFMAIGLLSLALALGAYASEAEHGAEHTAAAPIASTPPPAPSHAELRERYRKRLEEISKAKEAAVETGSPSVTSEKDLAELHALLKEREKKIAERETTLQNKERELNEKQAFLEQQLGKYEGSLGKLRLEVKSLETARDEKVAALLQVYEKMDAKKAARILDDLDADLSGRVLAGMRQQHAAEILSKMDPEKARAITKRFLSSNKISQ